METSELEYNQLTHVYFTQQRGDLIPRVGIESPYIYVQQIHDIICLHIMTTFSEK